MSETVFKLNRVDTRVGPVALVTIDNGEDHTKPTTLGRSALESAAELLDRLESGDWAAMLLTGKPFVFCVGADIDEFTKLRSAEEALEGTRAGHGLFDRIRTLPFPTVGAINGFLNNRLRIHSLILTLGMLSILQGAIFVFTDRSVGATSAFRRSRSRSSLPGAAHR